MRQPSLGFKLVASVVIALLQALMIPVMTSQPGAAVKGSILSVDDEAPIVGAKLHLGDPKGSEIYTSEPAGPNGGSEIENVPASTDEMAVEANGGLYLVQTPLKLAPDPAEEDKKKTKRGGTGVWNNPATALIVTVAAIVSVC